MWSFVSTDLCISLLSAENPTLEILKMLHCVVRITGLLLECLCNVSAGVHFRKLLRDPACLPVKILVFFVFVFFFLMASLKEGVKLPLQRQATESCSKFPIYIQLRDESNRRGHGPSLQMCCALHGSLCVVCWLFCLWYATLMLIFLQIRIYGLF